MAFRRRFGINRRYRKSRGVRRKRGMSTRAIASKALFQTKMLNRQRERKYFLQQPLINLNNQAANTWSQYSVVGLAQGAGPSDREGDQVTVHEIMLRFRATLTGDYGSGQRFRIIVLQDRQCDGSGNIPNVGNLLSNASDAFSLYNYPATLYRYKILHDKWHNASAIGYAGGFASGGSTWTDKNYNVDHYFSLKFTRGFMKNIRWYGTAATNFIRYPIYIYVANDQGHNSNLTCYTMVKYTDA